MYDFHTLQKYVNALLFASSCGVRGFEKSRADLMDFNSNNHLLLFQFQFPSLVPRVTEVTGWTPAVTVPAVAEAWAGVPEESTTPAGPTSPPSS